MSSNLTPRRVVDLVPNRRGDWAPATPQHRAVRTVRAWLRVWLTPTDPATYLGTTEVCLIRTRLHWVVPLRRITQAAVMAPLAIALTLLTAFVLPGVWWLQLGMGLGTVAHQLWLAYLVVAWRVDEIIVTDRRLIRVHGVFSTTVDAVSLDKITDSTYHQSPVGQLLGYGSLRVETAGQTQALERLAYVPNVAAIYRATLT